MMCLHDIKVAAMAQNSRIPFLVISTRPRQQAAPAMARTDNIPKA